MGKLDFSDLEKLIVDMDDLANMPDDTIKEMLNAESSIVASAQKSSAQSMKVKDSGELIKSITTKSPKKYKDEWRVYITFNGSRKRGNTTTRNAEIAYVNEYGKHGQPARPFIRNANESCADKAVSAAEDVYDNWLKKKNF